MRKGNVIHILELAVKSNEELAMTNKILKRLEKIETALAEREMRGRVIEIVWVEEGEPIGLFYVPNGDRCQQGKSVGLSSETP